MSRWATLDREILRLAYPALGALVAEPLFLLTDTAMVGHLGANPLAALGIAGTILQTMVGLLIFLAYATTPFVARRLGSGDRPGALAAGVDGLYLALGLGLVIGGAGFAFGNALARAFSASDEVTALAQDYLWVSWWGLPGMLLVLAATGVLRGLQDTMTPLVVALWGFGANAVLNAVLIYGLGLGLVGSALGTVIAQWIMAGLLVGKVLSAARAESVSLRPGSAGVIQAARLGGWLFVRTLSLRSAFVTATVVATTLGTVELATWHVAYTVFSLLALALDSLAIAGQALVGHRLGSGDVGQVRDTLARLVRMGLISGAVIGLGLVVLAWPIGFAVTSDSAVRELVPVTLLILAASMPLCGYVFVLDGVLIGAGDGRYLAVTGLVNLAVLVPFYVLVWQMANPNAIDSFALWVLQGSIGFAFMGARALTLGLRARGTRWMVVGADAVN